MTVIKDSPWDVPTGPEPDDFAAASDSSAPIGAGYAARLPVSYEEQLQTEMVRERARRVARRALDEEDAEEKAAQSVEFDGAANGLSFIFGQDAELEVIWGTPEQTAWAAGEAIMLFAPQGLGKTTLAQQLMMGRLGLCDEVLGMPVTTAEKNVLYIAGDRPRQAARAMRRLFWNATTGERKVAEDKLVVWKGPLPHNLVERPTMLREMAERYGCDTVFVDSIKDVIAKLNDDESGSMYNRAIQMCLVAGIQVCDLHHPRKADSKESNRPKGVDDVYGSTWLTAGHGSIISLWGKTGDLVVELSQLKMVNDEVGPFKVEHDHDKGVSSVQDRLDLLGALIKLNGLTVSTAAELMFATQAPSADQKAKARRALRGLVSKEQAIEHPGSSGGLNGGTAARWEAAAGAQANGGRTGKSDGIVGFSGGGQAAVNLKNDLF